MKTMKCLAVGMLMAACFAMTACKTTTHIIPQGGRAQVVTGFSQDDIDYTISQAVQSILAQGCLRSQTPGERKIVNVKNVTNDTTTRGRDAEALAEGLGLSLREELTQSGKILVYNEQVAQYATRRVLPQFVLYGRLTNRFLRQDNGDQQIEYSLNLQLVDLATGLEMWQKRIPVRKVADQSNIM